VSQWLLFNAKFRFFFSYSMARTSYFPWDSNSRVESKICIIDIWFFSPKQTSLMSKNKDWLDRNQDNVSVWNHISNHGLLLQWAYIKKTHDMLLNVKELLLFAYKREMNIDTSYWSSECETTYLTTDCCFNELALWKSN
jgi:hypothetical protein